MSEKVTYHQEGGLDREFVILAKDAEKKTVDIGPEGGPAVVTSVQITESAEVGKVTLHKEAPSEKSEDSGDHADKKKSTK